MGPRLKKTNVIQVVDKPPTDWSLPVGFEVTSNEICASGGSHEPEAGIKPVVSAGIPSEPEVGFQPKRRRHCPLVPLCRCHTYNIRIRSVYYECQTVGLSER